MIRISDSIWVIASGRAGSNLSDPFDCDVYMVDTGSGLVLVDAGVGPAGDAPLEGIEKAGFQPQDVRMILLTHGHADHSGNAWHLKEKTGARVCAHAQCAEYVSQGNINAIALGDAIKAGLYPPDYRFSPCPVEPLADGEIITIGNAKWTAIDTPGHCSGHMCYLMEQEGKQYLFAGDCIFVGGKILLQNIWDCSITEHAKTIGKLQSIPFDALLPSHFGIDLREGPSHVNKAMAAFQSLRVPPQADR